MDLKVFLYITAAEYEIDGHILGVGNLDKASVYTWIASEMAKGKVKKLLKRAYVLLNGGEPWKAKRFLERAVAVLAEQHDKTEKF